jgi:hypothetical protein
MPLALARIALATLAVGGVVACSLALDSSLEQCTQDSDCARFGSLQCTNRVCAGATIGTGPWDCVDKLKVPNGPQTTVNVTGRTYRFVQQDSVPNAVVSACNAADLSCATPVMTTMSDSTGAFTLQVPRGFPGFLQAVPHPPLLPSLLFLPAPYMDTNVSVSSRGGPMDNPDFAWGQLSVLDFSNNTTILMKPAPDFQTKGAVIIEAVDCHGSPAGGVLVQSADASPGQEHAYIVNFAPNNSATTTDSQSGQVVFWNLPPGLPLFTANVANVGQVAASSVQVRAGQITSLILRPWFK